MNLRYVLLLVFIVDMCASRLVVAQTWNEVLNHTPSGTDAGDAYGYAVDLHGNYAIVGAYKSNKNALGVDSLDDAGSVYFLQKDLSGNWIQSQKVEASDREKGDMFGKTVSIYGNYALVGAPFEDENESGTDSLNDAGSVYVFKNDGAGNWLQVQKLNPSDRQAGDEFGSSLDISDSHIIIGAYAEDHNASGSNTMALSGSAYIFEKDGNGSWLQSQKIVASDRTALDYFGFSVAIDQNVAVVGAFRESHDASGNNNMSLSGSAYVFERDANGVWNQTRKLVAYDRATDDRFGWAVSVAGNRIAVGAFYEDHSPEGSVYLQNAGSVYLFERASDGNWFFFQKIVPTDRAPFDFFGNAVRLSPEGRLIVGAFLEDEDAAGLNQLNDAGSVYIFEKNDLGFWEQQHKLVTSDRAAGDFFGASVAIDDKSVISGAYMKLDNGLPEAGGTYNFGLINNPNLISGSVYHDKNGNCIKESTEQRLRNVIIKTEPVIYYGISDQNGDYSISTDSGTYNVTQILPVSTLFRGQQCPDTPGFYSTTFVGLEDTTDGLDFGDEVAECPYLKVDVASNQRRRCFQNYTVINYCNEGFASANNAQVFLQLPELVKFVSADYPYFLDSDGNYVFDVGTVEMGECGTITVIDSVPCINGITGRTQCTKVWITPQNDCARSFDTINTSWNKSSMKVSGECINDTVRIVILNHGSGDMLIPQEYRIYSDSSLVYSSTYQLQSGDSIIILIPANGTTIRLEADQHPEHPGHSRPRVFVEGCGTNNSGTFSLHQIIPVPQDDEDNEVEIHCLEIRDSYDPNDKNVAPSGITNAQLVASNDELEYTIRFQNTGTDTAYRVVVVDTLSNDLDISTFNIMRASHNFSLNVLGKNQAVLIFAFDQINLPDSTTDELNSQGFVKFKIRPVKNLPPRTQIDNQAAIYFDFNIPVVTNNSFVTVYDTVLENAFALDTIIEIVNENVQGVSYLDEIKLEVFPNPFRLESKVLVHGLPDKYNNLVLDLLATDGRIINTIQQENTNGIRWFRIQRDQLPAGTYFFKISSDSEPISVGKLFVTD